MRMVSLWDHIRPLDSRLTFPCGNRYSFVDAEEQKPPAVWLRVCGSLVGAFLSGFGALVLVFLAAMTGASLGGVNVAIMASVFALIGGIVGFLNPRQTLDGLWIFMPGGVSD